MTDSDLPPVIEVAGLNHWYGERDFRKQVLFENRLEVAAGELVIMTGPSGSGKTTLLTLIGALRSVQEGSLKVLGRELLHQSHAQQVLHRRQIGFIFQAHNLFPALSALENVQLALDLQDMSRKEKKRVGTEMLVRLGLEHRLHAKPQDMSGGQRQRVAVARGLVHSPKIVLADEPSAALDKDSSRDVVDLLKLRAQEGCTILMVTHDNRILDVADRIVSMVDGRVVSDIQVAESIAICEFLRGVELFANHSPAHIMDIAQQMRRQRFSPGGVVVTQGEPGESFYLIRRGKAEVLVSAAGQEPQRVATLEEGGFFGEAALLTEEPRNATVRALEPLETYALSKADFQQAVAASASFQEQMYGVMMSRN